MLKTCSEVFFFIRCAVWDDRLVVCGLEDGSIILWNLVKEICHVTLEFHQGNHII